jgi:hypothetical protein
MLHLGTAWKQLFFPVALTEGSQFDMLIGLEHMVLECGLNPKL